jgi:hypothetical protein
MKFLAVRSAGYTQKTVFHVLSSIDCNCEAAVRNAVTSGILLSVFFGASQPASATYAPPVPCACARVDLMIICMADQLSVEVKRGDMRRAASCFQRLFSAAGCVSKAGAADGNQVCAQLRPWVSARFFVWVCVVTAAPPGITCRRVHAMLRSRHTCICTHPRASAVSREVIPK